MSPLALDDVKFNLILRKMRRVIVSSYNILFLYISVGRGVVVLNLSELFGGLKKKVNKRLSRHVV